MPGKKPVRKAVRKPSKAKPAKGGASKGTARSKSAPAKKLSDKARVEALEKRIRKDKLALVALRRSIAPEPVSDYTLLAHDGSPVKLSELFGSRDDLILVHNMGKGCAYCTMWADGFTGLVKHLENRAAFVVVSKDPVDVQRAFYQGRGWNFKMYSSHGTDFNRDMGYETETGSQKPGISAFHRDADGTIRRTGHTGLGPGDDFCAVWPMLDLLADGPAGWGPKFAY
ncbi:MAG: DUF899 family protein [candidate division Zixibacteria bacterium]|nr:DUF899 family protein [candidate division Zixibacteria bacterium]